jgi:TonB-dependent receptor
VNTKILSTLLVLGTLSANLFAQATGGISGTVIDAETGETLIGVNVVIDGTLQGTATDADGRYTLRNVKAGTYTLVVSYLSFATQSITEVVVSGDEIYTLDIALQPETEFLDEIVVTADVIQSGESGLLSIQRKAVAVQDGISSEEISKNTDSNVGTAIKRVSGVSVVGGNDVYVRGLGNRYNNIQLNGSPMPSTNPNKKEAPLDILSSGIVENIVVQKTFTPDQSGEFSGGSVQIVTKEFPSSTNFGISYSTSVNSYYSMRDYLGAAGGKLDFLGYDDGNRTLPQDVKDGEISSASEAAGIVNNLSGSWSPKNIQSLPSQKIGVNYARQFNEERMPIGVVSNLSYKYASSARYDEELRNINNYNENTGEVLFSSQYLKNTGIESANLSAMLNVFAKPGSVTKVGLKNLYSNSSNNTFSQIQGSYYNFDGNNRQTVSEFDRRAVYSSSLNVETFFSNFMESKLEVVISYAKAVRDLPDRRTTQYGETENGEYQIIFPFRGNTYFFSNQDDNNYTAKLDYSFNPHEKLLVKIGGLGLYKNRTFSSYKMVFQDLANNFPIADKELAPEDIFTVQNINAGYLELIESSSSRDSYKGKQELVAGYASLNFSPSEKWNLEGGVRAENSAQYIDGKALIDELDILPALNITYRAAEKINVRSAFSITLARPEFRELSNFNFQDFIGGRTVYGNPTLERTRIFNYDLRFEYYPNPGEVFAISTFYKKFENPIEIFYRITQNNEVRYENVDKANLKGIELEGRKDLHQRLRVSTNFSYILSEVKYASGQAVGRQANLNRPMYGQSPFTLNANAFYTLPVIESSLNISFNTFGKRISAVGNNEQPDDEYEQPFNKLDLSLSKNFGSTSVNLSIENLLGNEVEYIQGGVVTNRYQVGTTFSVDISYSFN